MKFLKSRNDSFRWDAANKVRKWMVEAGKNSFYLVLCKDAEQGFYLDLGELSSKFGLRFVVLVSITFVKWIFVHYEHFSFF